MSFAEQLEQYAFGPMFIYPAHGQTIERIWANGANAEALDEVIRSPESSQRARFLACEVFFAKDIFFMQRHPPEKVAQVLADALAGDYTGRANSWGLLYEEDDAGPVGIHFLTIGKRAIPALAPLLHDESTPLVYEGSEEATVGNAYGYRIKDFAAYYIGRILDQRVKYHPSPKKRDARIAKLEKRIASS